MSPEPRTADLELVSEAVLVMTALGEALTSTLIDAGIDGYLVGNSPMATLFALRKDSPQRPGRLAAEVGMTTGGMTKVIDKLVAAGFTRREEGVLDDGRGVLVVLTDEGRAMVERIVELAAPLMRKALDDLTALRDDIPG